MGASSLHSKLSASAANRWLLCPGSVRLSEQVLELMPELEETSSYALEGTAAHVLAEQTVSAWLKGSPLDLDSLVGKMVSWKEGGQEFQHEIGEEMVEGVAVYLDCIQMLFTPESISRGAVIMLEKRFDLSWIDRDLGGTCDCAIFQDGVLHVIDFKYGQGIAVEVEANPQLMLYAEGAAEDVYSSLKRAQKLPISSVISSICLVIVQPRAFHPDGPVRTWETNCIHLSRWVTKILLPCVKATKEENAQCYPGGHCRFCKALGVCNTQAAHAAALVKADFAAPWMPPDPTNLTTEQIGRVLQLAETCSAWLSAVNAVATQRAEQGEKIPGMKLVARRSTRKWCADTADIYNAVYPVLGDGAYKPSELLTPAQMEKALKKAKADVAILDPLVSKPDNGVTLVPEADRRAEVQSSAMMDFVDTVDLLN